MHGGRGGNAAQLPGSLPGLRPLPRAPAAQVDLTGNIGRKRVCSLASKDFENESTEAIDMCILDHG